MVKKTKTSDEILQFKVTLNDSTPRVWRRILVPSDYTFFALHCAIQDAMGWMGGHLHAFYVGKRKGGELIAIESPHPENDNVWGEPCDERITFIADYFGVMVKQCVYAYDFGDGWDHTVLLERKLPRDARVIYPRCVAGENACPPEDCGGVGGYEHVQNILKNPKHKEYKDTRAWLYLEDGETLNPYDFDPAEVEFSNVNERLAEWNEALQMG